MPTSPIIISKRPFNKSFIDEFSDEIIRYQHPHDEPNEFWYKYTIRKCLVYLWFKRPCRSQDTIMNAMRYALNEGLNGVKVTETHWKTEFGACAARPLQDNAFNAEYQTVNTAELTVITPITRNIEAVSFQGSKYAHKFMWWGSL